MKEALQQGNADGLCGLYAVLNFLRQTAFWGSEASTSDFWYLLESCQQFGWLTPEYLTEGFQDYQIKAILEKQFTNYRMPYAAYYAEDVQVAKRYRSFDALVKAVSKKGGWIVANAEGRGHWLLVAPEHNGMVVIDSASRDGPVAPYNSNQRSFGFRGSIVILHHPRSIVVVDL